MFGLNLRGGHYFYSVTGLSGGTLQRSIVSGQNEARADRFERPPKTGRGLKQTVALSLSHGGGKPLNYAFLPYQDKKTNSRRTSRQLTVCRLNRLQQCFRRSSDSPYSRVSLSLCHCRPSVIIRRQTERRKRIRGESLRRQTGLSAGTTFDQANEIHGRKNISGG